MAAASGAYRLQCLPQAKQEWDKLNGSIKAQFAKVLLRRLDEPRVPSAALTAMPDCYKIKLRSTGFRLVYRVQDDALVLLTIAVGKRDLKDWLAAEAQRNHRSMNKETIRLLEEARSLRDKAGKPARDNQSIAGILQAMHALPVLDARPMAEVMYDASGLPK